MCWMHHYFSFASTCRLILHHLSPKCKGFLSSATLTDSLRVYSTPAHLNAGCVMERSPDAPASSVSSQTTDTSWMGWLSIYNPACHLHPWGSHAAFWSCYIYINLPWSFYTTFLQDYMYMITMVKLSKTRLDIKMVTLILHLHLWEFATPLFHILGLYDNLPGLVCVLEHYDM